MRGCPQATTTPYTCPATTDFERASVTPHYDASDPPTYTALHGFMHAARDGRFDELRATLPH